MPTGWPHLWQLARRQTGRAQVYDRWEVLNPARFWFIPVVQPGGLIPPAGAGQWAPQAGADRRGVWRSTPGQHHNPPGPSTASATTTSPRSRRLTVSIPTRSAPCSATVTPECTEARSPGRRLSAGADQQGRG